MAAHTILGCAFYLGKFSKVESYIVEKIKKRQSFIVLPCSLNDLAALSRSPNLTQPYRNIDVCTADGVPLVWWARWKIGEIVERVYGPSLMKSVLVALQGTRYSHVFYGSSKQTLMKLRKSIHSFAPDTNILTMISPPYRTLTSLEERRYLKTIKQHNSSVLWIGLSSPKQVILASKWKRSLPNTTIFCVGAAFDLLAGTKSMAPRWMRQAGLEWLFRLISEPRRLWRRYLIDIPVFLAFLPLSVLCDKTSRST